MHGTGVAAGIRGAPIAQSAARVALTGQGRLSVFSDMTDLGTGSYTVLAQTAAEMMGLAIDQIDVHLADTDHPTSTGSLGQRGAISSASAVYAACDKLRAKIAAHLGLNHDKMAFEDGGITVADRRISLADLPVGLGAEAEMTYGDLSEQYAHQTFAAHFAEIAVHELTGEIRVRRLSSTCACGRILNPKTARSQILGAQIQGLGAALFEGLDVDTGAGFFVNHDLAGYEVPTHMDAPLQDVAFIEEEDATVSVLKAKGVGEIGICGVPAAIANAVFDATGIRFRSYPINVAAVTDML
nr:molybdopterin cofactor-binding domain-containing protein [Allosediminivita pacifica]